MANATRLSDWSWMTRYVTKDFFQPIAKFTNNGEGYKHISQVSIKFRKGAVGEDFSSSNGSRVVDCTGDDSTVRLVAKLPNGGYVTSDNTQKVSSTEYANKTFKFSSDKKKLSDFSSELQPGIALAPGQTVTFGIFANGNGGIPDGGSTIGGDGTKAVLCCTKNQTITLHVETGPYIKSITINEWCEKITVKVSKPTTDFTPKYLKFGVSHLYFAFGGVYGNNDSGKNITVPVFGGNTSSNSNYFYGITGGNIDTVKSTATESVYVFHMRGLKDKKGNWIQQPIYRASAYVKPNKFDQLDGFGTDGGSWNCQPYNTPMRILSHKKDITHDDIEYSSKEIDMERLKSFTTKVSVFPIRYVENNGSKTYHNHRTDTGSATISGLHKLHFIHPVPDATHRSPLRANNKDDYNNYYEVVSGTQHPNMRKGFDGFGFVYAREGKSSFCRIGDDDPVRYTIDDNGKKIYDGFIGWCADQNFDDKLSQASSMFYDNMGNFIGRDKWYWSSKGAFTSDVTVKDQNGKDKTVYYRIQLVPIFDYYITFDVNGGNYKLNSDGKGGNLYNYNDRTKTENTNRVVVTPKYDAQGAMYPDNRNPSNYWNMSSDIPVRENYRFLGWNTEKDGSGEYVYCEDGLAVDSSYWKYNYNTFVEVENPDVTTNDHFVKRKSSNQYLHICKINDSNKNNYDLTRLFQPGPGGIYYNKEESITVYAQWEPLSYYIKYEHGLQPSEIECDGILFMDGSMGNQTLDLTKEQTTTLTKNNYIRANYKFLGWKLGNSNVKYEDEAPITISDFVELARKSGALDESTRTITLTAIWDKNAYITAIKLKDGVPSHSGEWYWAELFAKDTDGNWKVVFEHNKL